MWSLVRPHNRWRGAKMLREGRSWVLPKSNASLVPAHPGFYGDLEPLRAEGPPTRVICEESIHIRGISLSHLNVQGAPFRGFSGGKFFQGRLGFLLPKHPKSRLKEARICLLGSCCECKRSMFHAQMAAILVASLGFL